MRRGMLAGLLAATMLAAPALAGTVLDTGPGTTGGDGLDFAQWVGAAFDISGPTTITGAEGWMFVMRGGEMTVTLREDTASKPGQELFSTTVTLPFVEEPALEDYVPQPSSWRGATGLSWFLPNAGRYWVTLEIRTLGANEVAGMQVGVANPAAAYARANSPPDLSSTPTDYFIEHDRQWGFRVTGDTAVPEPATWALMIVGFGLAGGALRRRRAIAA